PYGFVMHATRYKDHSEFLGRFHDALTVIAAKIPAVYMNRLGLRYVDFVLPRKGEAPDDYVDSRLNPQLDLGVDGLITAMSLTVYPMPGGRLTLRYIRGAGQPQLPPELSTVNLERSALMDAPHITPTQSTAIVDIDRVRDFSTREVLEPNRARTE